MPAQYVKAYIKRNKHDAADAEEICEAVQRPTMRFVLVKTVEQQSVSGSPAFRGLGRSSLRQPANFDSCSMAWLCFA